MNENLNETNVNLEKEKLIRAAVKAIVKKETLISHLLVNDEGVIRYVMAPSELDEYEMFNIHGKPREILCKFDKKTIINFHNEYNNDSSLLEWVILAATQKVNGEPVVSARKYKRIKR